MSQQPTPTPNDDLDALMPPPAWAYDQASQPDPQEKEQNNGRER